VRAVGVHEDVIVVTSRLWQTTATALRASGEAVLIDSPYFPDELELLPTIMRQAGFELNGLLATHGDWDHLLGRLAFPELALGVGQPTGERLRAEPGAAQRALREADAENYVVRPRPLALGAWQSLPVPGYVELGDKEIELHIADGHTADGTAYFARWAGVLVVGDYLSDVEIPMISDGGGVAEYRGTLARLAPLVGAAAVVVPGHGSPHPRDTALRILDEDVDYLDALERGDERPKLPKGRDSTRQRAIHSANLNRM
jgi:glyoxylase-like metal-dependent hydrolase (beta-lactamase superfamily II)